MASAGHPAHALTPPNREEDVDADMSPPDLKNRIQELLCTTLDHSSITVMQEKLMLKQRSSYHFVILRETRTGEHRQEFSPMSIDRVRSYLGPVRFQHVYDWMKTNMKLLLAHLKILFQEIIACRQDLEGFVTKFEQTEMDANEVASAKQWLWQIQLHISNFEARILRNLEPLPLNSLFLFHTRRPRILPVHISVVTLNPVMFHREQTLVTPNYVHLFWYIAGEQSEEEACMYEIQVKSTAPEEKVLMESFCARCDCIFYNLNPDTCYTFTVKRMSSLTALYEPWIDTLHLRTLSAGPDSRTEPPKEPKNG